MRRRDTVENGLVFVLELRGASNSSDQSTDDTHPRLSWCFFLYSLSQISTDGNYIFYATAQIMNEIKSQVQNF